MASHENNTNRRSLQPPILYSDEITSIPIAAINREDVSFRITTRKDVEDLIASIEYVGLILPPLLNQTPSGYITVSGFRRITACQTLGWSRMPAIVLKPAIDRLTCVQVAISENALQRPLNLIETSRSLRMLADVIPEHKRLLEMTAKLGLPSNPEIISKIEKLCHLPWPVQQGLINDSLSFGIALELNNFDSDIAVAFAQMFSYLKISLNKQRELLSLSKEIARRENIALQALIEDKDIEKILSDKNLDRNQKSQKLRHYLRQRRFPNIQKAEKNFKTHIKQLKLTNEIKLTPPKHFEGTIYNFSLAFRSLSELKTLRNKLDDIIQHPALKKILERNAIL